MSSLGRILLVEDDPKDVELTLTALEDYHLANEVVVARDGEAALDVPPSDLDTKLKNAGFWAELASLSIYEEATGRFLWATLPSRRSWCLPTDDSKSTFLTTSAIQSLAPMASRAFALLRGRPLSVMVRWTS